MECIIYNKYYKHYYSVIISILIIMYCFTYIYIYIYIYIEKDSLNQKLSLLIILNLASKPSVIRTLLSLFPL
jgi:hypothetical protein